MKIDITLNFMPEYIDFVSITNKISYSEATKLIKLGSDSFNQGFSGASFRNYTEFFGEVFSFMQNDSEDQVHETYKFHAPMDFLRMLSYPICESHRDLELMKQFTDYLSSLEDRNNITVVDYGCGLAQLTISICNILKEDYNLSPKLVLMDIDRKIHKEFLFFLTKKYNIECQWINITKNNPFPRIPNFDYIHVKDTFEHIYHPEVLVDNINNSIKKYGILVGTVADEREEFMHATPNLSKVRKRLEKHGFKNVGESWYNRCTLFQKYDEKNLKI
jgi:SAM-dependent methyltransferase